MMAEYIERSAIMRRIEIEAFRWGEEYDLQQILGDIEDAPAADVVEVRHGKWLPSRNGINPIRCDKCNMPALFVHEQDGFGGFGFYRCPSNYCPNCGAKMDGKDGADDA